MNNILFRIFNNKIAKLLVFCLAVFVFITGCDEGDSSHSFSSSNIGLIGYTEDQQLKVEVSHEVCNVGSTVSLAVTCRDSGGALLKDIEVLFSSDNGGNFSDSSVKTDDYGAAGTNFTPNREGTTLISVNAHGISKQISLQVYPSPIKVYICMLSTSSDVVETGKSLTVTVYVCDSSNTGVKDAEVNISAQFGTLNENTGKTDDNGYFMTTYKAPDSVGVDILTVMSLGETDSKTVSVQ